MVLNDIIADYEFIYKNLIRCEDYFKIGQSIIDNYFESTSAASVDFFIIAHPNETQKELYISAISSALKDCFNSITRLNSAAFTFYSCLTLLNSKQYNVESMHKELFDFQDAAEYVINSVNAIIECQYYGFITKGMICPFIQYFQKLLRIYHKLKDTYSFLLTIDQQLFESLPNGVEENSLHTYELRSYKKSFAFNDYVEDLRLINRFITQFSSLNKFNTPIYTRKIESGSLRIVWSGGEVEINCISDIINAIVNGIRNVVSLPSDIRLKKQEIRKATLENDGIATENISRTLAVVNSQIDILTEKLNFDKNNAEDIEKIQLLCTPLIDYLGQNPVGNINGVEYDLKNDLKYLTCHTRSDEPNDKTEE